ncbi:MAG: phenylalanine--tRNA ligase subunit beta, partial [Candidatus Heimdallarchaeaceae archaeon]
MVSIKASYKRMKEMLGKEVTIDELDELLAFAKSEIDDYVKEEDMLVIDIKTSNRPDLWCPEGMIREIKGILNVESKIPRFELKKSGFRVIVDKELKSSRPYIACAIAKKVKLDDYYIKQLMQHAEKIDQSYGRKRKRSSIGMYNLSMIKNPILYRTIEKTHQFIPLGYDKKMDLESILEVHEKGREYGQIVKDYGHFPILLSADGLTLSMPPIINSNDVGRITEETTDCLIEVTGTNFETVNVVLNIICQTIAEHGAEIYSVDIEYPPEILGRTISTPIINLETITVDLGLINKYLGTSLSLKEVISLLERRRFEATSTNEKLLQVTIPAYRVDILHWVDIAEEIVIAMDYNKIGPTEPKVITSGGLLPETESEILVRELLVGAGGTEVITNTLTDPSILSFKVNLSDVELVKIENPVSITYSVIRNQIYPLLLNVLSKNTHESYPQCIFEVGEIVKIHDTKIATQTNCAFFIADAEASFEDVHKRLHQFLHLLDVKYELKPVIHP